MGRFVPWDVLSLGRFVPGTLCLGTLCPWDVLSLGTSVAEPEPVGASTFWSKPEHV